MKEHEKKELERLEELRKTIEASPLTQQIVAEKAAAVLATRTEAAGRLEDLRKEQDQVLQRLLANFEEKELEYKKVKTLLEAAVGECQTARATLSAKGHQFNYAIRQQEVVLFETCDPLIDEAITFFREKLDWLRSPGRIDRISIGSERNIFAWKKTVKEESNKEAVLRALAYCQAAIKNLEQMKLLPALDTKRIQELKDGIPSIDVYTEVTGERPMEKINLDPLSLLPSESEMNWKLGNLEKKFKKIMRT